MIENLSEYFLTWIIAYGSPVLAAILLVSGIGLPLPASVVVIAAGAFIRLGMVDAPSAIPLAFLAVVAGDSLSYAIGRWLGHRLPEKVTVSSTWNSAENVFNKRGGLAILLTRSVISSLAVPTNLIAGSSRYSFRSFLFFDATGEAIWFVLYGGLGYVFGSQWELISDFLADFGGLIAGLVVLIVGAYYAVRWWRSGSRTSNPDNAIITLSEEGLSRDGLKE